MAFFAPADSSGPRASPCAFAVPARVGAPFPMIDFSSMMEGRSDAARACSTIFMMPSRSYMLPACVCQP